MKALTILQPWASLIACGAKKIETRGWATKYRGQIAIHAGKSTTLSPWSGEFSTKTRDAIVSMLWPEARDNRYVSITDSWEELPRGKVIAVADLVDCLIIGEENNLTTLTRLWSPLYGISRDGKKYQLPQMCSIKLLDDEQELAFGDYTPGRYAWLLENLRPITPVPARGQQGLWNWEPQS